MGPVLTAGDENWPGVVGNLKKARKSWASLSRIMGWEGAKPRVSGIFFKAVVQEVLLFRSETWVLTPHMGQELVRVQRRVAGQITGRNPSRREEGVWEYPPLAEAMEVLSFEGIKV